MTILGIETSTTVCSAAVCKDGQPIRQCICREGANHARLLPLFIEELIAFAHEQQLVFDAVALSEGPGSYTGLRIGTATAKGLCYGWNIPLIPVSTLSILCDAAKEKLSGTPATRTNSVLVPMMDARRMEVYAKVVKGDVELKATSAVIVENEDSLYAGTHPAEIGGEEVFYFGDGATKCRNVFTKPNWHFIPDIVPEARFLADHVETILDFAPGLVDIAYYEPYYLKEFVAAPSHVKGLK